MKTRVISYIIASALILNATEATATDICRIETQADDYGDNLYKIAVCCDSVGNCRAEATQRVYDRCHYETRSDASGSYNVLVCCAENGRCRVTRVR
jgi:hypothetical protein